MFENIGGKIKTLAKVVCWIGIIVSVILGLGLLSRNAITALLFIGIGSLGSWIGSFMTYGFGQLIENTDILVKQGEENR